MEILEDNIYLQQAKMNDFGNQVVIAALNQSSQNQKLLEKTKDFLDAQVLFDETIKKFDEREKMLMQKNLQIQDLQQRLDFYNQKNSINPS